MEQELDWNRQVWDLVGVIPAGKVATYGQLAAILGFPKRARHIGFALNRTPNSIQLPWHRVINSRGEISLPPLSEGGMLQRLLLEQEGIIFGSKNRINLKRFGWNPLAEIRTRA